MLSTESFAGHATVEQTVGITILEHVAIGKNCKKLKELLKLINLKIFNYV